MLFIGHTRFSLYNPDSVAWVASNGSRFRSNDEYKEYLFSEARLRPRFEIFLGESLPQLALASKQVNFYHVVSYSEHLPKHFEDQLLDAAGIYPFMVLDKHIDGKASVNPHNLARRLYFDSDNNHAVGEAFGLFRLDDDDLVSLDFFQQMSAYVTEANVGMLVSLGRGITGVYEDGAYYGVRESFRPLIAIGLLSVCSFKPDGDLIRPIDASHHLSDRSNPVIIDSRRVGYLWSRHITQDTALSYNTKENTDARKRVFADIGHLPRLSWDSDLAQSFPLLADRIFRHEDPSFTHWCLLSEPSNASEQPTVFDVDRITGEIKVDVVLNCGPSAAPGNALISFDLVGEDGAPLSVDNVDVSAANLVRSPNDSIGFYQYLNVHPGGNNLSIAVALPRGVSCRGISIRRWRNSSTQIELQRIDLYGRRI